MSMIFFWVVWWGQPLGQYLTMVPVLSTGIFQMLLVGVMECVAVPRKLQWGEGRERRKITNEASHPRGRRSTMLGICWVAELLWWAFELHHLIKLFSYITLLSSKDIFGNPCGSPFLSLPSLQGFPLGDHSLPQRIELWYPTGFFIALMLFHTSTWRNILQNGSQFQ